MEYHCNLENITSLWKLLKLNLSLYCLIWHIFSAGKAFVQATRSKTDEQLDEEVKMESEPVQVVL